MDAHALPVVDEVLCTACGDCVAACPKDLFSLHPIDHRLWVTCKSQDAGDELVDDCQVACTACGRCAQDHITQLPIQRCPTGAIVWLDPAAGAVVGAAATPVIRQGVRPDAPT
jgi:ferredoxin